jgi:tricorn protease
MNQGYFSQPAISENSIVFISDDDLWLVSRQGGVARRLTAHRGFVSSPVFSPDGKSIAYISSEAGVEHDVYLMPAEGGEAKRLTWLGVNRISGWKNNDTLYFSSGIEGYPRREAHVYELNIKTLDFTKVNLGPASYYHQAASFQVLAKNSGDSARWKRYQGGTAGVIWTQQGKSKFQRILKNIKTNLTKPEVIGKLIYFISDHEGVANVYSCDVSGQNVKRLTNHLEYYCRNLRSFKNTLVYQCGAEVYTYDINKGREVKVDISCDTTAIQSTSRFDSWVRYFDGADMTASAHQVAVLSRGQVFQMAPFSGAVKKLDQALDVRYVHPTFTFDGKKIVAATSTAESDEALYIFDSESLSKKPLFPQVNWGKIWEIKSSPNKELMAVVNNRQEIFILDLKKNSFIKIEKNEFSRPNELDWSPDGRYLVYSAQCDSRRLAIRIYDTQTKALKFLLTPVCNDFSPSFDPDGKYLYFLSVREFSPNYNETHFDLGFPFALKPYVVTLSAKNQSPFEAPNENPKPAIEADEKKDNKKKKKTIKVEIDFDGIDSRIEAFPLEMGGYEKVIGVKDGILFVKRKVDHVLQLPRPKSGPTLFSYKFEEAQEAVFQTDINYLKVNTAKTHVLVLTGSNLRLIDVKSKPSEEKLAGKKSGYLDTNRVKVKIEPLQEWRQMYRQAWSLQKEHFWRKDLSKIDWNLIFERYKKLLVKVKTRAEFSDLMWEMQGELGTSHCYEMLGDYQRGGAALPMARLGAYFNYDAKEKSYTVRKILKGDSWQSDSLSPLSGIGAGLGVGDKLLAIDGVKFTSAVSLYQYLENRAEHKVELIVKRKGSAKAENIIVKTARQQHGALYRDWVEANKKYVHEKSKGKLGYVHVPDMGPYGYAEFYKNFIAESDFDGMVVDVRFNGGGHVSQHLLKVLAQKVIGYDETRFQGVQKYPMYAPGVLVALANEHSGSDGDIFPQSFKLMKLGKLIGKRTWGGIIGINGQYHLKDGTWVTQPEYSFWFKGNEWYVENNGVEPDIEVDITPDDYLAGKDPQLERAVDEALKDLKTNAGLKFKPSYYPDLSIPKKLQKINR